MNDKYSLINAFEEFTKALKFCDVNKLNNIIADEYRGFTLKGTIESKEDILKSYKPGGVSLSTYEVSEIEYHVFSEIGIVSGEGNIAGSYGAYEFQHKVLFIDLFRLVNDEWKYFKSQVTEIQSD